VPAVAEAVADGGSDPHLPSFFGSETGMRGVLFAFKTCVRRLVGCFDERDGLRDT
jgi:hypothetical protein